MLKRSRTVALFCILNKGLIDSIMKKIKKENEDEFNRWCNREKLDKMTEKIENNCKINLVSLERDYC